MSQMQKNKSISLIFKFILLILSCYISCNLFTLTLDEELYSTGVLDYMVYNNDLASQKMQKVIEISKNDEYKECAYIILGNISIDEKEYLEAIHYYEKANDLCYKLEDRYDESIYSQIIYVKYLLNDSLYVQEKDTLIVSWQPKHYVVKNLKIQFLLKIQEYEKAIELIDEIQENRPDDPYFYLLKAIMYYRTDCIEKALFFLSKAIKNVNNTDQHLFDSWLYYWASIIYSKNGESELAKNFFDNAHDIDENIYKLRFLVYGYEHNFTKDEYDILNNLKN